jgi:hypothetical protein
MAASNHNGYSLDTYSGDDYSIKTYSGGYGGDHHGAFSGGGDCCPLVVDPLTFAALIGFIGLATYFFNVQIAASMLARSFPWPFNIIHAGWVFNGKDIHCVTDYYAHLLFCCKPE